MTEKKKLELRLSPTEGSQMYKVFSYLIRNEHLVGDGRTMANEAIAAFYLPFALEHQGEKPEVVQRVARDCLLLLDKQRFLLAQAFGLNEPAPQVTAIPSSISPNAAIAASQPEDDDEDFMSSLDSNYLFDDE